MPAMSTSQSYMNVWKIHWSWRNVTRNIMIRKTFGSRRPSSDINVNKLLMQWRGPYFVESRVGAKDYRVKMGSKTKTYHVDMLKKYVAGEPEVDVVHTSNKDDATIAVAGVILPRYWPREPRTKEWYQNQEPRMVLEPRTVPEPKTKNQEGYHNQEPRSMVLAYSVPQGICRGSALFLV